MKIYPDDFEEKLTSTGPHYNGIRNLQEQRGEIINSWKCTCKCHPSSETHFMPCCYYCKTCDKNIHNSVEIMQHIKEIHSTAK